MISDPGNTFDLSGPIYKLVRAKEAKSFFAKPADSTNIAWNKALDRIKIVAK